MLPARVSALASVEKKFSINVVSRGVILVGDVLFVELEKLNRFYQENQQY